MHVFIRADSSRQLGVGHIMRCLILADLLQNKDFQVGFLCQDLTGSVIDSVKEKGYRCDILETQKDSIADSFAANEWCKSWDWQNDAKSSIEFINRYPVVDLIVVDHYGLDYRWERAVRPHVKKIMVFDDLADRQHDCDIIFNQNLMAGLAERYAELVPSNCIKLFGPQNVLLRPEFYAQSFRIREKVDRLFVFFGGSDPTHETLKTLRALKQIDDYRLFVDVVLGKSNDDRQKIEEIVSDMPGVRLFYNVGNISELMAAADLAVGAGGVNTWERCLLGLPSITVALAHNQIEILQNVSQVGATRFLGSSSEVREEDISRAIVNLAANPRHLRAMSVNARGLASKGNAEQHPLIDLISSLFEKI